MNDYRIELFAQKLIQLHGFGSNEVRGFSCFIPDRHPFPMDEGLLLWSYSRTYSRIETQVQKFAAEARIFRMKEMLGLSERDYSDRFIPAISGYLRQLQDIGCFSKIGGGVDLFGRHRTSNLGADFTALSRNPKMLRELERTTVANPVVRLAEEYGYFKCQNKDRLAWEGVFG